MRGERQGGAGIGEGGGGRIGERGRIGGRGIER